MGNCIDATDAINSLRSLLGFHPGQRVTALIRLPLGEAAQGAPRTDFAAQFEDWKPYAMIMTKAESLDVLESGAERPHGMISRVIDFLLPSGLASAEVWVKVPEGFDFEKARSALRKKLADVTAHHEQHLRRLGNPEFQAKAAAEMKLQIEQRAEELGRQRKLLEMQLQLLGAVE